MTRIYLDAMGGDNAPKCTAEGAIEALRADSDLRITLGGDAAQLTPLLMDCDDVRERITVEHTTQVITNHDSPVMAVRTMKDSSIVRGMMAVRPALAPLMPNGKGYFLLIDSGANVDCKPEYLRQFAIMGDIYMRRVQGMKEPRVGLLNIGAESEKGNQLTKETYPLLENAPVHFVGNVEGRDVTNDVADVIVADGFAGNLILKFMEGMAGTLLGIIKKELLSDFRGKLGALIAKPAFKRVKKLMDYTEVGGAPLLGVKGAVVKAHGSSNGHAIACAIRQAAVMARTSVAQTIEETLKTMPQADE